MLRQKRKSRVGGREGRAQMQFMECAQSSKPLHKPDAYSRETDEKKIPLNPVPPGLCHVMYYHGDKKYPCLLGIELKDSLREIASFWRHKNNRLLPRYDKFWSCHQLPSASEKKYMKLYLLAGYRSVPIIDFFSIVIIVC